MFLKTFQIRMEDRLETVKASSVEINANGDLVFFDSMQVLQNAFAKGTWFTVINVT